MPYRDYVATRILRPLGMTSTTLQASEIPPARLARGYRWEDGRWKEEPPLPDGAFGSMGGMLTTIRDLSRYVGGVPRGLAAARRPRVRTDSTLVAARDAAAGPLVARRGRTRLDRRTAPERGRLRLRPSRLADLRLRLRGVAQRRPARLRLGDAVAAGLRGRLHRLRQPDVHGVGRRRGSGVRAAREVGRAATTAGSAFTGTGRRQGRGVAPRGPLGRRDDRRRCGHEPLPRPVEGAAARRSSRPSAGRSARAAPTGRSSSSRMRFAAPGCFSATAAGHARP